MQAKDLTDEHIDLKFRFEGGPVLEGTYAGRTERNTIYVNDVTYDSWVPDDGSIDSDKWGTQDRRGGYAISRNATVIQLPQDPKNSDPVRERLAEYIQAQMKERGGYATNHHRALILADIFTELMEGGPDA